MRLFVANIPYNAENSDLRDFFLQGGYQPSGVKIKRDVGKSRGIAFVDIDEDGQRAIEDMDGQEFMGRKLNVKEALPPKSGPGRLRAISRYLGETRR